MLTTREVRKSYGQFEALRGVSFDVAAGELFGLLGPNGAGKTTLMGVLSGLTDHNAGEVRLFGEVFSRANRESRRRIGLATQELAIYPDLTARENLQFFGKLYGLRGSDLTVRVKEMLATVELTDRADLRAGTFSGGMKRRLNLAVALIHRPDLLLLDEPTTGVDPQSRNHIFEQVRAQNAAGLTVIYTSHYMEEVQSLCPRIAILDHGKILANDTLPNLLRTLDSSAVLTVPKPAAAIDAVRTVAGVISVKVEGDRLRVTAKELPPLLPKLLTAVGEVSALEVQMPTLENVFLSLTGKGLRD
ncbi:MAG: ABC transporter ATP-binding protein [Fimbriiglobus sp.]|nr:ABC transporter ATP-binding protein [Fimbriiglobus sp.]